MIAPSRHTAVGWVAIGVSVALCIYYLVTAASEYLLDLDVYREAAEVAWSGGDVYAGRFTDVGLPWLYPPFAILFLTPMVFLNEVSAQIVWTLITLVAVIVYAVVCVWNFAADRFHTVTVIACTIAFTLAMEPTESGFKFGQINILLAMFMVLDLSHRTGRIPQGVLTGVAAAVKLTPLLLVVYYAATGRIRSAITSVASFLVCTAIAWAVFPQGSWTYWTGTFFESERVGVTYISNQSINAMVQRALGDTELAKLLWVGISAVVVIGALLVSHHLFGTYPHLTDALILATILLVSPISWTAHWILILPLLLVSAFPDRPVPLLQGLSGLLALALLYGVVRPGETAQILVPPQNDQLFFGNTFTWLTLLVGVASVVWYWSRVSPSVTKVPASTPD